MVSAIPAAKGGLLSLVQNAALDGVGVSYGPPGLEPLEAAWLGDVVGLVNDPSIGQVSHRESFQVPVVISIKRGTADHQEAEARAWAVAGPIESAIRANPSLSGVTGVTGAWIAGKAVDSYGDDDGIIVEIVITVQVQSRV